MLCTKSIRYVVIQVKTRLVKEFQGRGSSVAIHTHLGGSKNKRAKTRVHTNDLCSLRAVATACPIDYIATLASHSSHILAFYDAWGYRVVYLVNAFF